jgi:cardiolipin synthase (CMP-forming)
MESTFTVPNLLTLARLASAPWIGLAITDHAWGLACVLFLCAALTDALDGMLARAWQQESWLGACLDPLADKALILTCYGALMIAAPMGTLPSWFVFTILFKDLALIIGACGSGIVQSTFVVRPLLLGKIVMVMQTLFVFWILLCGLFHWSLPMITNAILSIVIITSVLAFSQYVLLALRGWLIWFVRD